MTSIASSSVSIQTSAHSAPSPPSWFGEVALLSQYLRQQGVLAAISEQVRFARRRFGRFEVIDFVAMLFGYALSGERTLEAFHTRLRPYAAAFMALFEREGLPSRSALSRFLAGLDVAAVEALRAVFLSDLLARRLTKEDPQAGLWDRAGTQWLVFDVDGTREAARQRALPQTADRPAAQRRLRPLCAPGYTGRKRGEVVRTRTTVLQAHTHQWLGTFGNAGNGAYRGELRQAVAAILAYLKANQFPPEHAVVRLDGQYGTAAVLADLAGLCSVMRGQDYHLLTRDEVQTRLHLPPDQQIRHPESGICRALYACPLVPLGAEGKPCRIIVATHPAGEKPSRVGSTREGVVYELFLTALRKARLYGSRCGGPLAFIAAPLNRPSRTRIRNRTRTAGVVTPPAGRSAGKLSASGSGTCVWNWATTWLRSQHAPRSLLRPCPHHLRRRLLRRGMPRQCQAIPGNKAASLVETLRSSPMARCAVLPGRRSRQRNTAAKPMGACAWPMPPRYAIVAPVGCVKRASGMPGTPGSHAG